MNAAVVVAELSAMGVAVVCSPPGKVRLTVDIGEVPLEAIAIARNHKPELIKYLRENCRPHNSPANFLDEPVANRPGWTRSTCSICGRFVGYREDENVRRDRSRR